MPELYQYYQKNTETTYLTNTVFYELWFDKLNEKKSKVLLISLLFIQRCSACMSGLFFIDDKAHYTIAYVALGLTVGCVSILHFTIINNNIKTQPSTFFQPFSKATPLLGYARRITIIANDRFLNLKYLQKCCFAIFNETPMMSQICRHQ